MFEKYRNTFHEKYRFPKKSLKSDLNSNFGRLFLLVLLYCGNGKSNNKYVNTPKTTISLRNSIEKTACKTDLINFRSKGPTRADIAQLPVVHAHTLPMGPLWGHVTFDHFQ
jgi:hypothetical protein